MPIDPLLFPGSSPPRWISEGSGAEPGEESGSETEEDSEELLGILKLVVSTPVKLAISFMIKKETMTPTRPMAEVVRTEVALAVFLGSPPEVR